MRHEDRILTGVSFIHLVTGRQTAPDHFQYKRQCATCIYQRSNRAPTSAPIAAGISIPSVYQMPMKGAANSGQCNA